MFLISNEIMECKLLDDSYEELVVWLSYECLIVRYTCMALFSFNFEESMMQCDCARV